MWATSVGSQTKEKEESMNSETERLGFDLREDSLTAVASSELLEIFRQEHTTPCQRWFIENGLIRTGIALDVL